MIISTAWKQQLPAFRQLVNAMNQMLNEDAEKRPYYYTTRGGKKLEEDVFRVLKYCATDTPFENTIELVSGASFPDIVANNMFGVEVKSTEKNKWQSIGSSILESTRNQGIERIYLTFGKLGFPVRFITKPYEDCLSDIAVTHYPRYRIDMQLQEKSEQTIFEKMHVDYDVLRKMDNPIPTVSKYYRSILKDGESLWWAGDNAEEAAPMTARLWTSLTPDEKESLTVEGYALFPELLSKTSKTKYNRYALWLATQKGVINTNIRDGFSAGGQVELMTAEKMIVKMPAAFGRINRFHSVIRQTILEKDPIVLSEYWKEPVRKDRIRQWCDLVASSADNSVGYSRAQSVLSVIFHYDPGYTYESNEVSIAADSSTKKHY